MNPPATPEPSKLPPLTAAERAELLALWRDPGSVAALAGMAAEGSRMRPFTEQENMEAGFLCLRLRAEASDGAATTNDEQPTTN